MPGKATVEKWFGSCGGEGAPGIGVSSVAPGIVTHLVLLPVTIANKACNAAQVIGENPIPFPAFSI